ncbi:MAG: NAD(P)H-quinone oxidoreductase [Pseudomonadota bacterium]
MDSVMRAVEITEPGGPEVLNLCERPIPKPGPSEVLIRVSAAGVNRPDVLQRMGLYPPPPGASDLPGLEVAGTIAAIGENVNTLNIGDAVCALLPGGGYAEYATADIGTCLPVPSGLTMAEAAALPETVFTVYANVFDDADLREGETLLVHGATSGIGVTAIAMARAFGADVIATAGTDEKVKSARDLGVKAAFNYKKDDWDTEIKEIGGVNVVLDMAGGDFLARNLETLNSGGRHVSIAFLRGNEASVNIFAIMKKQLNISGSTMKARSREEKSRLAAQISKKVWPLIESGDIKPVIDRTFALEDAAKAHKRMEAGAHVGKIVLAVQGDKI